VNIQQALRQAGITDEEYEELMAVGARVAPQLRRELYDARGEDIFSLAVRIAAIGLEHYPVGSGRHDVLSSICDKVHALRVSCQTAVRTGWGDPHVQGFPA
jgi:hypothetical protein